MLKLVDNEQSSTQHLSEGSMDIDHIINFISALYMLN